MISIIIIRFKLLLKVCKYSICKAMLWMHVLCAEHHVFVNARYIIMCPGMGLGAHERIDWMQVFANNVHTGCMATIFDAMIAFGLTWVCELQQPHQM